MALALAVLWLVAFVSLARSQQAGNQYPEVHPSVSIETCTTSGGCVSDTQTSIVLDSNWRWLVWLSVLWSRSHPGNFLTGFTPLPETQTATPGMSGTHSCAQILSPAHRIVRSTVPITRPLTASRPRAIPFSSISSRWDSTIPISARVSI